MPKIVAPLVALCLIGVGACGSSTPSTSSTSTSPSGSSAAAPASGPSKQALMVCLPEVQKELAAALSVPATAPVVGHWVAPDYSCTYRFPNGSIRLVVRDVASKPAAAAYLAELVRQHGRASSVNVGADDAVLLKDGSLAARKDRHVLFVDVSGLPPRFGSPPMPRDQVAYSVGGVIMSCWKGDGS